MDASPRHPKTLAKSSLIFNRFIGGLGATLRLHFELILGSKIARFLYRFLPRKMMPKWLPKGRRDIWENLALGSLGAHVSHKAAQVARGSSKLSPRRAPTAQNWTPKKPQGRPDRSQLDPKGHPKPSKFDLWAPWGLTCHTRLPKSLKGAQN